MREAVQAGAVGFSTSRFTGHRDQTGQLAPGSLADTDELIMIAKEIASVGGAMSKIVMLSRLARRKARQSEKVSYSWRSR